MRRTAKFILNFAIGFLLLLVCSFYFLLASQAPMPIGGTIAGVRIGQGSSATYIPGQEFSCTKGSQPDRCKVTLQNHPLEIAITYADANSRRDVARCTASYLGLTTNCAAGFHDIVVGGWLPVISIQNNLGLSHLQLQELKRQELHRPNIVSNLGELKLLRLAQGIAIAIGLVTAASGWLFFGQSMKVVASICISFVVFRICWLCLAGIPFNVMLNYGVNADIWIQLVNWISLTAGIATGITAAYLVWSRRNRLVKVLISISGGYGAFALSSLLFLLTLLGLGYAD